MQKLLILLVALFGLGNALEPKGSQQNFLEANQECGDGKKVCVKMESTQPPSTTPATTPAPSTTPATTPTTTTTTTVEEVYTDVGTWSLLNLDRNIGISMVGDEIRGQDFAADSPSWSDLGFFGRYSVTFLVSAPSKFHKLMIKDQDGNRHFVKIQDEMYVSGSENRYRLKKTGDEASASPFQIRRSGIDDKMGGSPFWITAQHNGKTVVFIVEDVSDDGWGNVHMREENDAPGDRATFYLEKLPDISSADNAYESMPEADTYYIFNRHYKNVATPFRMAGDPEIGWSTEWGHRCRLNIEHREKPRIKFHAKSQFVRDQGITEHFEITDNGNHWKIGDYSGFDMELYRHEHEPSWVVMRKINGNKNLKADYQAQDTKTDHGTNGNDQSDHTAFQFARILGDGASAIGASSEVGMP
eukprot:Selendium_serpulae@DN6511_c4_g1_i11.p1